MPVSEKIWVERCGCDGGDDTAGCWRMHLMQNSSFPPQVASGVTINYEAKMRRVFAVVMERPKRSFCLLLFSVTPFCTPLCSFPGDDFVNIFCSNTESEIYALCFSGLLKSGNSGIGGIVLFGFFSRISSETDGWEGSHFFRRC